MRGFCKDTKGGEEGAKGSATTFQNPEHHTGQFCIDCIRNWTVSVLVDSIGQG